MPFAATAVRFTDDDRAYLERLCELTGLDSYASVIRLAVRESVNARDSKFAVPKGARKPGR